MSFRFLQYFYFSQEQSKLQTISQGEEWASSSTSHREEEEDAIDYNITNLLSFLIPTGSNQDILSVMADCTFIKNGFPHLISTFHPSPSLCLHPWYTQSHIHSQRHTVWMQVRGTHALNCSYRKYIKTQTNHWGWGQQNIVGDHTVRGWAEHMCARYSLQDAALEHAEAEQKAMQEWSKRANKGGGGLRMAVCVLYVCVSQVMLCAISFMMHYTWHNRHTDYKTRFIDTETHTEASTRLYTN